jgi:hypothetical protein
MYCIVRAGGLAAGGTIYAAKKEPAASAPSEFYIMTEFFSDMLSQWAKYVLDVRCDGEDTR